MVAGCSRGSPSPPFFSFISWGSYFIMSRRLSLCPSQRFAVLCSHTKHNASYGDTHFQRNAVPADAGVVRTRGGWEPERMEGMAKHRDGREEWFGVGCRLRWKAFWKRAVLSPGGQRDPHLPWSDRECLYEAAVMMGCDDFCEWR